MSKKLYTAYGLVFNSDFEIPELLPGSGETDVSLRIAEVPEELDSHVAKSDLYQVNENQFLLKLEKIAKYWVRNGNEILVQPAENVSDSELRLFLLGTCLGVLLHQRGILALHASAIETPHGAVLFSGPSGIGKSTLLAAFLKRGYFMLADDVVGIVLDRRGVPIVLPAIPRTKLWSDAANHLGHDLNTLPRLRPSEDKFELGVRELFAHRPVPLNRVYLLTSSENLQIEIIGLDKFSCFQAILNNTYREFFLDGLDRRKSHFFLATAAANHAIIRKVIRPVNLSELDNLVKLVEFDFLSTASEISPSIDFDSSNQVVGSDK